MANVCIALLVSIAAAVSSGCARFPESRPQSSSACVVGVLSAVWNGGPRFFIAAKDGTEAEVLLADSVIAAFGGAPGLNRKHVWVRGEWQGDDTNALRASQLEITPEQDDDCP